MGAPDFLELVNTLKLNHPDLYRLEYMADEVELFFANTDANPWTVREFKPDTITHRTLSLLNDYLEGINSLTFTWAYPKEGN